MKSPIFLAGVALAILTPSVAMAQDDGCKRDGNGRIIGTAVGAGAGGVLGNVIAGRGDKTEGTIIGAIVGAVVGNQVSKSDRGDCRSAYGFYDEQGRWHATGVNASEARGYYDRNGGWVDGPPNGYYDNGRWVISNGDRDTAGYVDRDGHWVPASSVGYYDRNNRWVGGTATGYYDTNGRWVAGPTRGRYDARGRWIAGDTGYANENSPNWNAVEQPGYYDTNGRWVAGRTYGYYDARGRWVSTRSNNYQSNDNRADNQYRPGSGQYDLNQMPTDISTRIIWMREYVRSGVQARRINQATAEYARRELSAIEAQNRQFNRDGRFTQREENTIDKRLDRLTKRLDKNWRQARRY
ncbi:glycine zipper 2TM domain-containing protein [Sphingorhabdus sp.]|uniref:glycine zipper 2TM domain-containing protein n=1 Tax=Sphingorhabdus sp. TaxID=1902408 RepID=UPI003919C6CD